MLIVKLIISAVIGAFFSSTFILFLTYRSKKKLRNELAETKAAKDELLFIIGEVKETSRFTVRQTDTINRIVIEDKGIDIDSPFA